jgi:dUTP pyrophosphatase
VAAATGEVTIALQQLDVGLPLPAYAHPGDAGADLHSAESFVLAPGERRLVPTGIAIAVPDGFAAFVHPRSGLAARHGISIVNAPGTVDAGYRGEVQVCLVNTDHLRSVTVSRGDRIAQLVVQPVSRAAFLPVAQLPDPEPGSHPGRPVRGQRGHGSTGGLQTAHEHAQEFQQ